MHAICKHGSCKLRPSLATMASIETSLTTGQRFTIHTDSLADFHFHYPTNTLSVFTDGSIIGDLVSGAVYYYDGCPHNKTFCVPIPPSSTGVELAAIEQALAYAPNAHHL